ncbi:MAG: DUF3177 family protein [Cyanobacteria bacterium P01_H01_bin.119]
MYDASVLLPLVWADYRLAVLFTVLMPLGLLLWAFVVRADSIQHLITIYWKVASLLAITVYLMIGGFAFSFIAALMARILIPIGLWFWADLNEEIREQPESPLKFIFTAWRWAVTVYSTLGAVLVAIYLPCAFSVESFKGEVCQSWLQPPLLYKQYFHANTTSGFLGFLAIAALIVYLLSLGYFVIFRLGRQGRTAINQ